MVQALAIGAGFDMAFALPPRPLFAWRAEAERTGFGTHMLRAVEEDYAGAHSVLLLVWPYAPYAGSSRISAYYINSNAAFFAAKRLAAELCGLGVSARRVELPARAVAEANGIGAAGRNGLLRLGSFGSRIVLETLICDLPPAEFDAPHTPACGDCTACASACPTHAIGKTLDASCCLKCDLLSAEHTEAAMELQRWYIGCEACMFACPHSPAPVEPPEEVTAAFDMRRLIEGDAAAARALAGRNITGNGRLTAEAIAFAAQDGLYESEIRRAQGSAFSAVRRAAEWALARRL